MAKNLVINESYQPNANMLPIPKSYKGVDLTTLSDKTMAFAEAYSNCLVVANACRQVGYSPRHGHRLLQQADVNAYLNYLADNRRNGTILRPNETLELLSNIARGESHEEVITPDGRTILKGTLVRDRIKALEILAKGQGLLVDKVEVSHVTQIDIGFADEAEVHNAQDVEYTVL